jgi:MerR family transcriptional regulator, thiopeptide resistance regulator
LGQRYYRTGQFAQKASVSVRTLRYYDKEGLLEPSDSSRAGYRLYTDEDLINLQQILALKFLGFSLDEIKVLMRAGLHSLPEVLAQQKAMMRAKRAQLDGIIGAIDQAEDLVRSGQGDWDSLVRVIRVIQMEQDKDWVKKYFTPEQMEQMNKLSREAYSDEARERLASRGTNWTEADQEAATAQWDAVNRDLARLAAANADPASEEAQDLAARHSKLIAGFTGGDPEIEEGLNKFWQNLNALPEDQKPLPSPYSTEEQQAQRAWMDRALEIYRQRKGGS